MKSSLPASNSNWPSRTTRILPTVFWLVDLKETVQCFIIIYTFHVTFQKADSGTLKKLGDGLRRNPDNLGKTADQIMKFTRSGKHALAIVSDYTQQFLNEKHKKNFIIAN